jgi:hypothetical protein
MTRNRGSDSDALMYRIRAATLVDRVPESREADQRADWASRGAVDRNGGIAPRA